MTTAPPPPPALSQVITQALAIGTLGKLRANMLSNDDKAIRATIVNQISTDAALSLLVQGVANEFIGGGADEVRVRAIESAVKTLTQTNAMWRINTQIAERVNIPLAKEAYLAAVRKQVAEALINAIADALIGGVGLDEALVRAVAKLAELGVEVRSVSQIIDNVADTLQKQAWTGPVVDDIVERAAIWARRVAAFVVIGKELLKPPPSPPPPASTPSICTTWWVLCEFQLADIPSLLSNAVNNFTPFNPVGFNAFRELVVVPSLISITQPFTGQWTGLNTAFTPLRSSDGRRD
jgi:hypothetical protein